MPGPQRPDPAWPRSERKLAAATSVTQSTSGLVGISSRLVTVLRLAHAALATESRRQIHSLLTTLLIGLLLRPLMAAFVWSLGRSRTLEFSAPDFEHSGLLSWNLCLRLPSSMPLPVGVLPKSSGPGPQARAQSSSFGLMAALALAVWHCALRLSESSSPRGLSVRPGGPPGAPLAPPSGGEPAMPPSLSGAPH